MKDMLSKYFRNTLALVLIALTFGFDTMFLFIQYPERNHDTITMIAGVINTVGFASVVSFLYVSSQGSKDKQEQIDNKTPVNIGNIENNTVNEQLNK
jgi:predicted permease